MMRQKSSRLVPTAIMASSIVVLERGAHAQSRRHIKVVVETKQTGTSNQEAVQGSGSVIIRRGGAQPSGRLTAGEKQTTVQRSSGIFTLVQDGGESILSVATRVPQHQVGYYRDYASGIGYIDRHIFTEVGLRCGSVPALLQRVKSE